MKRIGLLILVISMMPGLGCARRSLRSQVTKVETVAPALPTWGLNSEGLQCRLRPTKRIWRPGEPPVFRADLRNQGTRMFAFVRSSDTPWRSFCIDSRWHPRPTAPAVEGKVRPLGPGVEFMDLPVSLPESLCTHLGPGRHRVQIAFSFEGVEVVSGPVDIEVAALPQASLAPAHRSK